MNVSSGGKRNVGTCYFWNEGSMHPIEVNYLFRVQVLANMRLPNPELHCPHAVFTRECKF